jgi:hypothetical protein
MGEKDEALELPVRVCNCLKFPIRQISKYPPPKALSSNYSNKNAFLATVGEMDIPFGNGALLASVSSKRTSSFSSFQGYRPEAYSIEEHLFQ